MKKIEKIEVKSVRKNYYK